VCAAFEWHIDQSAPDAVLESPLSSWTSWINFWVHIVSRIRSPRAMMELLRVFQSRSVITRCWSPPHRWLGLDHRLIRRRSADFVCRGQNVRVRRG
jgi:hypothetical protein